MAIKHFLQIWITHNNNLPIKTWRTSLKIQETNLSSKKKWGDAEFSAKKKFGEEEDMDGEENQEREKIKCKILSQLLFQKTLYNIKLIKLKIFYNFGDNCTLVPLTSHNHPIKNKTFQFVQFSPSFLKFSSPIIP